jgi:hypothetical protein
LGITSNALRESGNPPFLVNTKAIAAIRQIRIGLNPRWSFTGRSRLWDSSVVPEKAWLNHSSRFVDGNHVVSADFIGLKNANA